MPATLHNKTTTRTAETVGRAAVNGARAAGVFTAQDEQLLNSMHISLDAKPKLTNIRAEKPPLFERINNNMAMTAAWMGTAAIGGIVSLGEWAEDKGAWAKPLRYMGEKMAGPKAALDVELGHATSTAVEKISQRIKFRGINPNTPEHAIATQEASHIGDQVRSVETRIKTGADTLFTHMGTMAEKATTKGPVGWARNKYIDHLRRNIGGSKEMASFHHEASVQHLDQVLAKMSIHPELEDAHKAVNNARKALTISQKASAVTSELHGALNHVETGKEFETVANRLAEDKSLSAGAKTALKEASAGMKRFTKYATAAQGNFASASATSAKMETLNNIKSAVGSIPGKIGKMKLEHLPNYTWYGLSQGTSAVRGVRAFTTRLDTLENMYASVTGTDVKNVSGLKLVLGLEKMPDSMKGARKEYWHHALIDAGTQALGMVAFHKVNRPSGGANILTMVAVQGATSAITSIVTPKNSMFQAYRAIAEAHAAGEKAVPKSAYAALIAAAKPELRELSINDPALMQVAQHYAQTNAKASTVLKDMDSKLFDKLLADAKTAVAATKAAASAKAPVGKFTSNLAAAKSPAAAIAPATGTHADRALASKATVSAEAARV